MRVLPASPAFYGRGSFGRVYEKTMTGVRKIAEKALFDSSAVYVVGGGKDSLELASVSSVHLVIEGLSEGKLYTDRGDWWPMSRFLAALLDMTEEEAQDSSYTVRAFREVVLLAIHLLRAGNAIPELVRVDENALSIRWMPTEQDAGTAEASGDPLEMGDPFHGRNRAIQREEMLCQRACRGGTVTFPHALDAKHGEEKFRRRSHL